MDDDACDQLLADELMRRCAAARKLIADDRMPRRETATLVRDRNGALVRHNLAVADHRAMATLVTREAGFWDHMLELTAAVEANPHVESSIGWERQPGPRARALWGSVLAPALERYGSRRPDYRWDRRLARRMLSDWRTAHIDQTHWRQTLAPLHNFRAGADPIQIEPNLRVRPFTDSERADLYEMSKPHDSSPIAPSVLQLDAWSHVIEYRWRHCRDPRAEVVAHDVVRDVVRALRLHHPGMASVTLVWTRWDPPDHLLTTTYGGGEIFSPHGVGYVVGGLTSYLAGGRGAKAMGQLLAGLRALEGDRHFQLAARRFDASYFRHETEDSLIDLWVCLEALLAVDDSRELRLRTALRIAQLAGKAPEERVRIFAAAKRSYDARSKVVHGSKRQPKELPVVTEETRLLAQAVLRRWVLAPEPIKLEELESELLRGGT
jgi:hypothetical protein